jgi:hypothetical protein
MDLRTPFVITLPPGPLVEQVEITPAMCQQWLKYLAPLLADATSAQGQFTVKFDHAQFPLLDPTLANAEGAMLIHQAQVGPGPLAREFLTLAQQIRTLLDPQRGASRYLEAGRTWIELPEQAASFRVADGRVAHANLTMIVGDVTIRTGGWVAFNQQMHLVAEIPIQDAWVADQRLLAGLRGQTLSIPVHGTLDRPQLDRRALQTLTQQAVRGAAEGLLQEELQKQLNRLLPR